jgi:hypothetical protein
MAKLNVYALRRPKKEIKTFKITDDSNPDAEFTVTIREPDLPTILNLEKTQQEKIDFYLTPNKEGDTPQLPPIDGEFIKLTDELIQLVCLIQGLQYGPEEDKLTFEEIAILLHTMEAGMLALLVEVNKIAEKFSEILSNPTGAVMIPQSQSSPNNSTVTLS